MNEMVGFKDIVKKSLIETNFVNSLDSSDIVITLGFTFLIGIFIFYIYKKTFQGVLYTQSFNISLVMISMVTSLVIMTISSNLILSLGMVGALSIVRFRTAIKDSMDIVFMFWAIAVGIANGAKYFKISIIGSLFIALVLIILTRYKEKTSPYLLIINYDSKSYNELKKYFNKFRWYKLKSKTITQDNSEITLEIRSDNEHKIVEEISKIKGIKSCVMISYNGDYVS